MGALLALGCGGNGDRRRSVGEGDEIASTIVAGLTDDRRIVFFDTNAPGTIRSEYAINERPDDDPVVAMDFRPNDSEYLYLVTEAGRLFRVEPYGTTQTGTAGFIGTLDLGGAKVREIDVNPVADRIRVATSANGSLRVDPTDASTVVDARVRLRRRDGDGDPGRRLHRLFPDRDPRPRCTASTCGTTPWCASILRTRAS